MRFAGRLAAQLAALAVLVTALVGVNAHLLVGRTFEGQLRAELERRARAVSQELDLLGGDLTTTLQLIHDRLQDEDQPLLRALLSGRPEAWDAARALKARTGIDALEILDEEGTIVSSSAGRSRLGLAGDPPAWGGTGRPRLRSVRIGAEERPGWTASRTVVLGSRSLTLVGSRVLNGSFLERVAGSGAALVLDASRRPVLASARAGSLEEADLASALEGAVAGKLDAPPLEAGGRRWQVSLVPLPSAGRGSLGAVLVAVERGRIEALLARMRWNFVALAAAVGLLAAAAGLWIARRTSRPVRDLVRAFDAIASGAADYGFPDTSRDELQELVASISRLQRALDLQRERSSAAERVATWRDVARHVAHEVKNPLVPIRLTIENLLRARERAPDRFDAMFRDGSRAILEEVDQLQRMVEEFSAFARLPLPSVRYEDLDALVDGVLELHAADPAIRIERIRGGDLPPVPLDADQISRALRNVVGNAVEAVRAVRGEASGPLAIEVRTAVEGGMARIDVSDRGPGLSEEASRRLFEPYFSTKSEGTGLGMALTYRIIIDHGGVISAANRPGGGAALTIRLPLREEREGSAEAGTEEANP